MKDWPWDCASDRFRETFAANGEMHVLLAPSLIYALYMQIAVDLGRELMQRVAEMATFALEEFTRSIRKATKALSKLSAAVAS